MAEHTERRRQTVASILRQNGAYLVNLCYPGSDDQPDSDLYDAASSLEKAKRIARQGQPENVEGAFRWEHEPGSGIWWLSAVCVDEWETHEEVYDIG